MLTKRQLVTRILLRMNKIASEETPTAADMAYVGGEYDSKRLEWRDRGLCWWPNTSLDAEEIPDAAAPALIALMANVVGPAFGMMQPLTNQLAQEEELLRPLRRLIAKHPTGEDTVFDIF